VQRDRAQCKTAAVEQHPEHGSMRHAVILITAASLAGCASAPQPVAAPRIGHAVAGAALLQGFAAYRERIALAPGATLDVQLIGTRDDAPPATIAAQTFAAEHGPPYAFALRYERARVPGDMHCSLRAALRDARGHLEFVTAAAVPVMPGGGARIDLPLVRVDVR
jgi:putative lipoprotein